MKIKEIREKSEKELAEAKKGMKHDILSLRIQQKSGQLENPARLRSLRKGIARIETVLTETHKKAAAQRSS